MTPKMSPDNTNGAVGTDAESEVENDLEKGTNNNNTADTSAHANEDSLSFTPKDKDEQLSILNALQRRMRLQYDDPGFDSVGSAIDAGLSKKNFDKLQHLLEDYGPNELPKAEIEPYWKVWIGAFKDIMMILLLIAMFTLYIVGDWIAATAILVILMIATNISAYTEYTSNIAAAELGDLPGFSLIRCPEAPDAKGTQGWLRITNAKLLPGMIVQLKTGDIVPADAIILTQKGDCSCSEAMLTGESEPVAKFPFYQDEDEETPAEAKAATGTATGLENGTAVAVPDKRTADKREAMTRLYMGTEFSGECVALLVETGKRTQMGRIFQSMADEEGEMSPLQKMIDRLIMVLAMLSIAASAINAAICIPTGRGIEPDETDPQALVCVLNSVALTVAAVPENLPVALVIALAAIIKQLARRGVIVKSLPAGEELSRLNYVFSDKTGTLTKNEMTARAVLISQNYAALSPDFVGPEGSKELDKDATSLPIADQIRVLAAISQDDVRSNPTGDACKKAKPDNLDGMDFQRILLETATSQTKMARAAVTIDGNNYLIKVGSDWVLQGATGQATLKTNLRKLDMSTVEEYSQQTCMDRIDLWARDGYRMICVAAKPVDSLPDEINQGEVGSFGDGFIFLGCIAIQDPPREDVAENIRIITGAGIVVTMITGDNAVTGMSIARQIGLAADYTEEDMKMCLINAYDLFRHMEEEDAKREIHARLHYSMTHKKGLIIGRVSPHQKRWFVEVAKNMKLVTAMTGDGANDAPALRCANVGIAMGNGSDIAKAAGDMILVNPSFTGIVQAIREGRLGFDNILKFLLFLLGTNISEVIIYLTLTCFDFVIVLDALNLLVLNLLTDGFPAIALSLEEAEGDLMKRAPLARNTSVLNKFTYMSITFTNTALMISYLVVILQGNIWHLGDIKGADTGEYEDYGKQLSKVRMMFILLINISELLLGFSHRAPDRSIFTIGFFSSKYMNWAALSSIALIILMTHIPGLKDIMRTEYIDWQSYLLVLVMSVLPFVVHEISKVVVFERLNYSVYELYKYEYKPTDVQKAIKKTQ